MELLLLLGLGYLFLNSGDSKNTNSSNNSNTSSHSPGSYTPPATTYNHNRRSYTEYNEDYGSYEDQLKQFYEDGTCDYEIDEDDIADYRGKWEAEKEWRDDY